MLLSIKADAFWNILILGFEWKVEYLPSCEVSEHFSVGDCPHAVACTLFSDHLLWIGLCMAAYTKVLCCCWFITALYTQSLISDEITSPR